MSSNCREVCLEVYVNGELYCTDSVWVPDEENVQVEFMVTDRIYELLGCSPGQITAQLEVDTDECMSVSHAALDGEDVQINIDMKHPTCTCTTPENSPTESTTEWMKRKISGFFQMLFWMDPAVPEPTPETDRVPEPEPEVNLVSVCWPAEEPGIEKNSPKRVMKKVSAFFKKYFPIDPAEPSCDPETEPELDLVDPNESCVPVPSVPEPEPLSAEGQEVDVSDGMDASPETPEMNDPRESTKEKKMRAFFKKYFPLDPSEPSCVPDASVPEPEPVSAEGQEVDLSDGMDASPEKMKKMKKMRAFFKKYFPLDSPEPSCVPETEPELDLFDSDDSCVPGPSSSVTKPYSSTPEQELSPEEHCLLLEKRVKGCTQRHRPVTAVWNNIFIGNEEIARDRMRLKELGITHVLNAAAVKTKLRVLLGVPWEKDLREAVNTGASYYRGMNISYCGLPATHGLNISEHFYKAAKFICKAKKNPENKVFIHCTDGISYGPTLFLAYLMLHHNMTVEDAIDHLIKVRYIKPDIEFLKQLAVLNQDLVRK